MQYEFCIDGDLIIPAEAIKLTRITNTLNAILRRELSSTDTVQIFLDYAQAFGEDYEIRFIDACVLEFIANMMLSIFLALSAKATYKDHIRISKAIIMNDSFLPLLVSLPLDAAMAEMLGFINLDGLGQYITTEQNIFSWNKFPRLLWEFTKSRFYPSQKPSPQCKRFLWTLRLLYEA